MTANFCLAVSADPVFPGNLPHLPARGMPLRVWLTVRCSGRISDGSTASSSGRQRRKRPSGIHRQVRNGLFRRSTKSFSTPATCPANGPIRPPHCPGPCPGATGLTGRLRKQRWPWCRSGWWRGLAYLYGCRTASLERTGATATPKEPVQAVAARCIWNRSRDPARQVAAIRSRVLRLSDG